MASASSEPAGEFFEEVGKESSFEHSSNLIVEGRITGEGIRRLQRAVDVPERWSNVRVDYRCEPASAGAVKGFSEACLT